MARKKKTDQEEGFLSTAAAISAAFDEYKDVRCVSLERGGRVENALSTNSLIFDLILGGGFQRGRIAEIFGPEGSGKTTIIQEVVVSSQQAKIPCIFYDTEHAADPTYMKAQGIDLEFKIREGGKMVKGFYYVQPGPGEEVYRLMLKTLSAMPNIDPEKSGPPTILFAIDSFAAMFSEAEDLETMGKGGLGRDARMHSLYLRKLRSLLKAKGGLLVMTNQIRMKLNLRNPNASGEGRPGGNALKFYADYVIRVSTSKRETEDATELFRQHLYFRTIKNKCFPPFRECESELIIGRGIDKAQDALAFLKAVGKHENRGAYHRVLLKRFDTGKGLNWKQFRKMAESPEFREHAFGLLKSEKVYAAYFKQIGYKNYSYDQELSDAT